MQGSSSEHSEVKNDEGKKQTTPHLCEEISYNIYGTLCSHKKDVCVFTCMPIKRYLWFFTGWPRLIFNSPWCAADLESRPPHFTCWLCHLLAFGFGKAEVFFFFFACCCCFQNLFISKLEIITVLTFWMAFRVRSF